MRRVIEEWILCEPLFESVVIGAAATPKRVEGQVR